MAITATAALGPNATIPTGGTNPTLPSITSPNPNGTYSVDTAASAANVDPIVGMANMLGAIEADFEGTYAINELKLNPADTVTAALVVTSFVRMNTGDDTSKFKSGTEVYRCVVSFNYE